MLLSLLSGWGRKGSFHSPAILTQSLYKSGVTNIKLPTPPRDTERPAFVGYHHAAGPVIGLLLRCCPSAVGWSIAKMVINSVYGVRTRRGVPHVCVEVLEAVDPPAAYGNTFTAVFRIARNLFIKAPVLHVHPGAVDFSTCHAVRLAITANTATARPCPPLGEVGSHDGGTITTLTSARPQTAPPVEPGLVSHGQFTKDFTSQIYERWHFHTLREALLRMKEVWQSASEGRLSAINLATGVTIP